MDTLTHALSGALLACATARTPPAPGDLPLRTRIAAASAGATFPDVDFALRLIDTLTYLNWHQGPTHSLLLLPAWALLLAHAFARLERRRHGWRAYLGPVAAGMGIHIAGDAVTAYGLMLWAPLSTQRFSLPLVFVIDPWLTALLVGGLIVALWRPSPRPAASLALAAVAAYVATLGTLRTDAIRAAAETASSPGASVHALPQPLSPLHWKLIVQEGDAYRVAHLRLGAEPERTSMPATTNFLLHLDAAYRPAATAAWEQRGRYGASRDAAALARAAWNAPAFAPFRRFAAYPAVDGMEHAGEAVCVWFVDLRFTLPGLPPSFRYGACRDATDAPWQLRRQRGRWWID